MVTHDELPPLEGFEVLERIGRGGAAQVYLARSPAGRLVAIKVLSADIDDDDGALAREASMCARLTHPAIVQLRTLIDKGGVSALVFEYVRGVALGRVLRVCQRRSVRLPDAAGWHVVERVLSALAYAHAQKDDAHRPAPIVHRDVSPANVLIDWEGEVKLGDFGLAKWVGNSGSTKLGMVKGTLGCMAPEQARGESVTERADVYAAGLLAWQLATGRAPFAKFHRDELEMLRAMRNPRIRPLGQLRPDLPAPVLDAFSRALELEPSKREVSAEALSRVVREHFDLAKGKSQLAELLYAWRDALERTVTKTPATATKEREDELGLLSGEQSVQTMRYEEVALAFDEPDWGMEEPLPSDARIPAVPVAEVDLELPPVSSSPSLAPPPPAEPRLEAAEAAERRRDTVPPRAPAPQVAERPDPVLVLFYVGMAGILLYVLVASLIGR
jgi:serine/threonine-protein kinase